MPLDPADHPPSRLAPLTKTARFALIEETPRAELPALLEEFLAHGYAADGLACQRITARMSEEG